MSTSNARNVASSTTSSTLRPRTKRLISGLDDDGDELGVASAVGISQRLPSPSPTTYRLRPASPIPPAHPQRTQYLAQPEDSGIVTPPRRRAQKRAGNDSSSLSNLWGNPWNALQGIASDLLGTDVSSGAVNGQTRTRRPLSKLEAQRATSDSYSSTWSPSSSTLALKSNGIGGGTREEQTAAFRAQKRKDMLMGVEGSFADAMGRYKRRLSDERASTSAPPPDQDERGALVYVHNVTRDDTLAGITIRYGVAAEVLRKANRMWPNDTVQSRQTLLLPVDACSVKGRPCPAPGEEIDLLTSETEAMLTLQAEEVPPLSTAAVPTTSDQLLAAPNRNRTDSLSTNTTSHVILSLVETETSWKHDSWVMLPGHNHPVEIARLPRRTLGYFPPARRKSQSFSDAESRPTSIELSRENAAVTRQLPSPMRYGKSRASSHNRHTSNANNGYFGNFLSGPGGVGTMNSNVRQPGPAQDGLNKMFAKHLPDVAPPRHLDSSFASPVLTPYSDDPTPTPIMSGSATPAYPHAKPGGPNLNLENMGGAIESWVRRITASAMKPLPERQKAARASVGAPGKGAGGIGDLIEMTDEFEIGDDGDTTPTAEGEERQGRALEVEPVYVPSLLDSDGTGSVRRTGRHAASKSSKGD